tara:strand:- start:74965 stop:75330 length:366 start_codon:yes stop_codon:yes gene_type:complete
MKISFDFDSTLSRDDIQQIADDFIMRGHDVHITTSRHESNKWVQPNLTHNHDLFKIAEELGIPMESIHFTEMKDKVEFLEGFDMHFDDDEFEIDLITRSEITCLGILINYKNYVLDLKSGD